MLRPGGTLHVVVPDLAILIDRYLKQKVEGEAAQSDAAHDIIVSSHGRMMKRGCAAGYRKMGRFDHQDTKDTKTGNNWRDAPIKFLSLLRFLGDLGVLVVILSAA